MRAAAEPVPDPPEPDPNASFDRALQALLDDDAGDPKARTVRRRQAAETLHQQGTAEALDRLDRRKGHAVARAYLRETRWDVPGAGRSRCSDIRVGWRRRESCSCFASGAWARLAGRRWLAAAARGRAAGAIGGILGGLVLRFRTRVDGRQRRGWRCCRFLGTRSAASRRPGSEPVWPPRKAAFRARRRLALAAAGASSGLAVGAAAHLLGTASCSRACSAAISLR